MDKHHGRVIERIVRRTNMSLSDVSQHMGVNRRSMYNWFNLPKLKPEIIFRLGRVIQHDFSHEFPEFFSSEDFRTKQNHIKELKNEDKATQDASEEFWKEKYISLLEKINETMTKERIASA